VTMLQVYIMPLTFGRARIVITDDHSVYNGW
jgi:hypothetical protein